MPHSVGISQDGALFSPAKRTLVLSEEPFRLTLPVHGGDIVRITAQIICGANIKTHQALLLVDFGKDCQIDPSAYGLTRSHLESVGLYRYLRTSPGTCETVYHFSVPEKCQRVSLGIRSWHPADSISMTEFTAAVFGFDSEGIALRHKAAYILDSASDETAATAETVELAEEYRFHDVDSSEVEQVVLQKLSPTVFPIRCVSDQRLRVLRIARGSESGYLGYIVSGSKIYIKVQRALLPFPEVAAEIIFTLFLLNPRCKEIEGDISLCGFEHVPGACRTLVQTSFLLELPPSFEDYRRSVISINLRKDNERDERRLLKLLPDYSFRIIEREELSLESFREIVDVISRRLDLKNEELKREWNSPYTEEWLQRVYPLYRDRGFCTVISGGGKPISVALVIRDGSEYYYMASGYDEEYEPYSIGKVLLYRLIEKIVENGGKRVHLGGGDFGYKRRFGAKEVPLYNVTILRPQSSGQTDVELFVKAKLRDGVSMSAVNRILGCDLEDVVGLEAFERMLGVDFYAAVDKKELSSDDECRGYSATSKDAFTQIMAQVPVRPESRFLDVGCGKGAVLYYATRFGFGQYRGLEVSAVLAEIARQNLANLNLDCCSVVARDARDVDPLWLNESDVFFLSNPFSARVLETFLDKVARSVAAAPREIWIVYCSARFPDVLTARGYRIFKEFLPRTAEWRFSDYAAIFHGVPGEVAATDAAEPAP